jgi:geranylgeranyl diphosphate synthase, type II
MTQKELLDAYLNHQLTHKLAGDPPELYEPANYIMNLGGKRIRPLLCLMGNGLFQNDVEKSLPLAHAIELFHNFTLVHDDIIDQAPLRRGQTTVHEKWDLNRAILTGDTILVRAFAQINSLSTTKEIIHQITALFCEMAEDVCRGQQMDVNFENQDSVSQEDYIEMIRLKTSVLLGFSLQSGAIMGGADQSSSELLYKYGLYTGIAFQIMDDHLDAFGGNKFGKQIGGDILTNKKTILLIELLKRANETDSIEIKQLITQTQLDSSQKVKSILAFYEKYEIQAYTNERMASYLELGTKLLDELDCPNSKQSLYDLNGMLSIRRE